VVSFPRVSVLAQYVRGASGGGIDYRFAVFLIPLIFTIFNFFASVVGDKVVSAFNTAFDPLNFQALYAGPFGFARGYMPVLARLPCEVVFSSGGFGFGAGFW
jgi:hypothetical protein